MQATVLTIAGSDPTGGAGIQADLKTMTSIGVYGAAAITCITVQNSHGVVNIECLPPELVYRQIKGVLEDHMVTHVKTGMVGSASIAEAICEALSDFSGEVVCDPVMLSSTGQSLMENNEAGYFPRALVSRSTVITPNLPELSSLSGAVVDSQREAQTCAVRMLETHENLRAVVVKGGHRARNDGMLVDLLVYKTDGTINTAALPHPRIQTRNSHGTGCTLASAFASYLSLGNDYIRSFHLSVEYVQSLLKSGAARKVVRNPDGAGGLLHYTFRG